MNIVTLGRLLKSPVFDAVDHHRIIVVTLDELHRPGGRAQPQKEGVAWEEIFRESDELNAFLGRLPDKANSFVDSRVKVEKTGAAWTAATLKEECETGMAVSSWPGSASV